MGALAETGGDVSGSIPWRVGKVEDRQEVMDETLSRVRENVHKVVGLTGAQATMIARHEERLASQHENIGEVKVDVASLAVAVTALADRVATSTNRIAWTFVGFSFTLAGSAVALVITQS